MINRSGIDARLVHGGDVELQSVRWKAAAQSDQSG
jgi:hypothetical protein